MALPPGRKPLTDADMIKLLRDMATGVSEPNTNLEANLQQTADRFEELSKFDIESLDPDERSWYYDGDGTKRLKIKDNE
jgi:hypothetical protein